VKDAIRKQNTEIPGGRLTWGTREEGLRTLGRIEEAGAFNEIIVADVKGAPVRVKDIGYAVDGEEEARTLSRLDGENAVSLLIRKQSGTNTVKWLIVLPRSWTKSVRHCHRIFVFRLSVTNPVLFVAQWKKSKNI
jgi:multidrug efflux pump subunit AcrB